MDDKNDITRRIIDFALEIIFLLSGEDYTMVRKKSGDCVTPIIHLHEFGEGSRSEKPTAIPPPHSPICEKRILELTNKITELLTGEVPLRCQDVAVFFSIEEWDYLEGNRYQYEDEMMKYLPPSVSQDGSRRRNSSESCLAPLYSQDYLKENVSENEQDEDLIDIKVEVIDDEEETDFMDDQQYGLDVRNSPERCSTPLYSQDCPESHQDGDLNEDEADGDQIMDNPSCASDLEEDLPGIDPAAPQRGGICPSRTGILLNERPVPLTHISLFPVLGGEPLKRYLQE
ncbi:uncharacterized protein LOC142295826 [Anomaloglossus baeobatrachus]|uniref:uncharacterized protein LOC142295826 n=1 Tax=Anomaloglossus baeobatrachus TaxID=238106 RepID=UPI003F50B036